MNYYINDKPITLMTSNITKKLMAVIIAAVKQQQDKAIIVLSP